MQTQTLSQIKQQIIALDPASKRELAEFLVDEIGEFVHDAAPIVSDEDRNGQIDWLKNNRERYARKYVALSGSNLVGEGETFQAAQTQAKQNGFPAAFVTYVYSENDEAFGGW